MRKQFRFNSVRVLVIALVLSALAVAGSASAEPWKFGVISDTQWTVADDGKNPNTVAADIIKQVDKKFIEAGVKLVVAVGDTANESGDTVSDTVDTNIGTRALFAQDLYNHHIGFYPLRGNHEATEGANYLHTGLVFQYIFPQIGTMGVPGLNNLTPADITTDLIPAADLAANPPASPYGWPFKAGKHFTYPTAVNTDNNSISYSFDYKNARFILLDQFDKAGEYYPSTVPDQLQWIDEQISDRRRPDQVFVFAHKNILGGNHKDNMFHGPFGNDPGDGYGVDPTTLSPEQQAALLKKQSDEDAFITLLADHNVRFCISGHDHHHYHSIVRSPLNPDKSVHQLITQSDSSKFYTPKTPWSGNDIPLTQDLYKVGYYIVTVDGPRATIDYYGSQPFSSSGLPNGTTPPLSFTKLDSFSYSLNGKEFQIGQGDSYAMVKDRFGGTTAEILGGVNSSTTTDNTGRALSKAVNTGWSRKCGGTESDILTLSGMADLGSASTDTFTLSMSYGSRCRVDHGKAAFEIVTKDKHGRWVNAVDMNNGGSKKFVVGPWNPSYGLGTYGVDPGTGGAWTVINHNGDFAIAKDLKSNHCRR